MEEQYRGVIIEESLADTSVLKHVKIISTKVENVTDKHATPWVRRWTLHTVVISASSVDEVASLLSAALDPKHSWYADFRNKQWHYIIFLGKIFKVDRTSQKQYDQAKNYGLSLGIPSYQVDFHPGVASWER